MLVRIKRANSHTHVMYYIIGLNGAEIPWVNEIRCRVVFVTRTRLRYVRVFAIANPSVCRL